MSVHDPLPEYKPGWREWVATCPCGWVGSYLPTQREAEREAARHVAEAEPAPGDDTDRAS